VGRTVIRLVIVNWKFAFVLRKPDYFKRSLCRLNFRKDLRVVEPAGSRSHHKEIP